MYFSSNRGKDFELINNGLGYPYAGKFALIEDSLFVSTPVGLYSMDVSDILSSVDSPKEYIADYLYAKSPRPNPTKNKADIEIYWSFEHNFDISNVKIYDYLGSEVAQNNTLSLEIIETNHGILSWNCSGIQAGIYIIAIKYGNRTLPVKVVVM